MVNQLMPFKITYRILLFIIVMLLAGNPCAFSQKQTITEKDSIRFTRLNEQYNNCLNTDAKKADSLARIYFAKAKKIRNNDYCGRGAVLLNGVSLIEGNIDKAMEWRKVAIGYFKKSNNYVWIGYINLNMGIIFDNKYNFEKGLPYLLQSVKDFEKAKDNNMIASAYTSIANSFHNFGNYEEGKKYAQLAITTLSRFKDAKQSYQWRAWNALAINYDDNKEWDKAIETHNKALAFAGETNGHNTYNNLGNTYRKKGMLKEAMEYLTLSLNVSAKEGANDYHYATLYGNIADVYRMQQQYELSRTYIDSTLYYSEKTQSPEKLIDAYYFAYQYYNDTGNYKAASGYLKQYVTLKDSLLNADKAKIIYAYKEKYEAEKKQKLIELQEFEITKRNYWLIIAAVLFLLFCSGAYFAYRTYTYKQGRKLLDEIYRQKEIEAKALFDGEQKERIRIARDLHDGVGQMLSLVKMNLSMVEESDSTLIKKITLLVDKTIDEVRNVSHNLIPQELNFGIFKALEDIAEKVNSAGTTKMEVLLPDELKEITFERQNELTMYRIVQEVVNNMIKHAGADKIELSISRVNNSLIISITDNGRGLDQESISNSKGLGWKNINARVHLLDGKINITSEKLSGTRIEITLPGNGGK